MMVLAAGPFANLLFALLAYWVMFMIGIASILPIIGNVTPGSIADLAGLKPREEVVSIDNKPIEGWEAISVALVGALGTERTINIVTRPHGFELSQELETSHGSEALETSHTLPNLQQLGGAGKGYRFTQRIGHYAFRSLPSCGG